MIDAPKVRVHLGAVVATVALLYGCSSDDSKKELNLLTFVPFVHEDVVGEWQERTGCNINATLVGTLDEIIAKIALGATYDLVSASLDTTTVFWKMGKFQALNRNRLPEIDNMFERFTAHPSVTLEDGTLIGQPQTWGSIPYMYRTDKVSPPPTSVAALFDERYSGKISMWDDKTTIYIVARMLFGTDTNVFDLSDEQLQAVKEKLIEQKKHVRSYWTQPGDHINLLASGEAWITNTWSGYQVAELNKRGLPFVEFIPEEKADAFVDVFMLMKDAENTECAYEYLNFVGGTDGQCRTVISSGLSGVNPNALKTCLTPEQFEGQHMDDSDYLDQLVLQEEPARLDALIDTWNAVKIAGE